MEKTKILPVAACCQHVLIIASLFSLADGVSKPCKFCFLFLYLFTFMDVSKNEKKKKTKIINKLLHLDYI